MAGSFLCSGLHQDGQGLLVRDLGARLEFRQRAAADRMLDRQERVVGQAEHPRDVARRDLEGCGAEDHRALAELFEGDAVVQTARGAGPSITQAGDQEVDLLGDLDQCIGWRRGARILLRGQRAHGAAVMLHEQRRHLVQHLLGIELAVLQDADAQAVDAAERRRTDRLALGRGGKRRIELHRDLAYLSGARIALCCMIEPRPRLHDGMKQEWPPASPPPMVIRMSSGVRPRCMKPASASACAPSPCWVSYSRSRYLPTLFMPSTERLAWVKR